MYRQQIHVNVVLGKYREFYDCIVGLNEELERKGLKPAQIWAPATGADMNTVVLVTDFDTLAEWDEQGRGFMSDPDTMKIWRDSANYVEGRVHEELLQSAWEIA